jgi:TolB-like protein/Flp pilus assembly protein TadD
MSAADNKAVFLSYASQDAEAARRICEALRSGGVEVWFDADGGLEHGDEWDAKIRRQIKECVLFIPIISASTQARHEGYFRIEWDLAAERARGIASGVPFILPVVIDDTREPDALVPDRFRMVQWTKLRGGEVPPEVQQRFLKLWSHRTGVLKNEADVGRGRRTPPDSETAAIGDAALQRKRSPVWLAGGAVALVIAAAALWKFWPGATSAPRDLELARAAALFDFNSPDSTAEGFALADDILKTVLAKRPADTDAVILYAWLNELFMIRGFDMSEGRRALARQYSERAVRLAPQNPDALAAQGVFYSNEYLGNDPARAEQLLRQAIAINPRDPRYHRMLSFTLVFQEKRDEARRNARHALELFPDNALVHYDYGLVQLYLDDFDGAEKAFRDTLAFTPPNSLLCGTLHADLAAFAAFAHADLPMMKDWLDKMPVQFRDSARESMPLFIYAFASGDTERALTTVGQLSDPWLRNYGETPKALIAGDLLVMQGKTEQAHGEYEAAHVEVTQARAKDPNKIRYRQLEVWTLLRLGRLDEARAALSGVIEATSPQGFDPLYPIEYWYGPLAASLALGDRESALSYLRKVATTVGWRNYFRNLLQIDPRVKEWRSDPEIVAQLSDPAKSSAVPAGAADAKSVAVLAFANLSNDKDNEYFSDGISEELLTVLQKISGLHVAARTSAFSFKGKNATAQEIGEKLGVAHLVEGSVQKIGNRVKITARLSRAATNEDVWSKSFGPLELTDVFATQSEIALAIVTELRGKLTGEAAIKAEVAAAERGGTKNAAAHEQYLQGQFFLNQNNPENAARPLEFFRRAVELDEKFAQAWAGLARTYVSIGSYGRTVADIDANFGLARRAADRALTLEPNLAEGYCARMEIQCAYDFDWKGAEQSLRRALALAPANAEIILSGARLANVFGQPDKVIEIHQQVLALDPLNLRARLALLGARAQTAMNAGKFPEADVEINRMAELVPPLGPVMRVPSYLLQERFPEALAEVAKLKGDWPPLYWRALVHWGQKHVVESDTVLNQLIADYPEMCTFQIAAIYAYRRQPDQAFEWLERAYRHHDSGLQSIRSFPFLRNLHADPRWTEFLRKLGLADDQLK